MVIFHSYVNVDQRLVTGHWSLVLHEIPGGGAVAVADAHLSFRRDVLDSQFVM